MPSILEMPALTDDQCELLSPDGNGEVIHNGVTRLCLAAPPRAAMGEMPHAKAFPLQLIGRDQWDEIIARKDAEQSWLWNVANGIIPCKNQASLGYCHAYGNVAGGELARYLQGHPYVALSGPSIGGPVTNWRNTGADPSDDLEQLATVGACPESFMDSPHSLSPRKWKSGWEAECAKYRATEIWDGRDGGAGKMFDLAVTACLLNVPGGVGYSWWSHFVSGFYRVRKVGNRYEGMPRNNWGDGYGDNGFFWLAEGKGTPTWATYIRQMTAVDA